ncbi:retrovirus-related pol polyprotein from transposon TNT 1-94 [Tanacetum coccineum]
MRLKKNKSLVSATPLSTAFISTSIVQDFQDSLDDEEDTRSSHEYPNDLEEEYQARALLAKSKRFFKKDTQRPELRPTKDFEAKYNKVKAKLALLSSSASVSKDMVEVKVLMALAEENDAISKEGARNGEWVKISDKERIISLRRGIKPRNLQHVMKSYETYGSTVHTTTDHNDIEWFRRGEELQAKKAEALKSSKAESSNANRSKTPTRSGCSRHMTGVKSYLHKYMEQPGPKVVFGDDSTCTTEGYGSIKFYIHNHKDHLGKFDEKADDGYLLGYSLVSKAFRVFNTRRQQTEETYHITFDESPDVIKFSKPSVDNINIAENERFPSDEYLHPYKPSQRYQTNSNDVSFIEPYECPELVVLETEVSSDQNGQTDQNDQSVQNDEILSDDHSEHSNHTNDEQIIDNLPNTKDIQISEHSSSPRVEDTSVHNTILILNSSVSIPPMVTPTP